LAIIAMQMTPMMSCIQRNPLDGAAVGAAGFVLATMLNSSHRAFYFNSVTRCRKVVTQGRKLKSAWYIIFQVASRNCCCDAATYLASSNENHVRWHSDPFGSAFPKATACR
jgi:hypothetical protein